uniref:Uncharacterized protein n=1 Tax=Ditylenchus dipsaci TaxID=166011 RepID=A0A915CYK5_9BILA
MDSSPRKSKNSLITKLTSQNGMPQTCGDLHQQSMMMMMLAYPPMERITAKAALCLRYLLNVPISTALPDISTLFSKT